MISTPIHKSATRNTSTTAFVFLYTSYMIQSPLPNENKSSLNVGPTTIAIVFEGCRDHRSQLRVLEVVIMAAVRRRRNVGRNNTIQYERTGVVEIKIEGNTIAVYGRTQQKHWYIVQ